MKKWLILVVVLGLVSLAYGTGNSDESIQVKEKEAFTYVYMPFSGTYEFYLNSPMEVKPEELLTRIEIPVKKK